MTGGPVEIAVAYMDDFGLTKPAWRVGFGLYVQTARGQRLDPEAAARYMGVGKARAAGALEELEARGWISRQMNGGITLRFVRIAPDSPPGRAAEAGWC